MNYNVGDTVRVKSLDWYNNQKDKNGDVNCGESTFFASSMSKFCGSILTIKHIDVDLEAYKVEENDYYWSDEMFEELAKNVIQPVVFENIVFPNENYADKVELCLGDDYEIVVEDGRTFVQRKKLKYPTTYEVCCDVLGVTYDYPDIRGVSSKEYCLYSSFIQLIRCRDAYWKIAGDEMGLGKSWEYDMGKDEFSSAITYRYGLVQKNEVRYNNHILVFPTAEMRDAFYENFKDLIGKCEKLL